MKYGNVPKKYSSKERRDRRKGSLFIVCIQYRVYNKEESILLTIKNIVNVDNYFVVYLVRRVLMDRVTGGTTVSAVVEKGGRRTL